MAKNGGRQIIMANDLRNFLQVLTQKGLLKHVDRKVSSKYEVAALLKQSKGEIPLVFNAVDNYQCPLVAGLGGTREILALSMNVKAENLPIHLANAIVSPLPPKIVDNGAVHENIIKAPFSLDDFFPVLMYGDRDPARFLVSGIMLAMSMDGEQTYTSIRRMQYLGKNRCCLLVTSYEMKQQIKYYEEIKKPMPVVFMFGVHPAVILASQISTHSYHVDKLGVTGALLGESIEVLRAKTVDLPVMAQAEMVLEGYLYPWKK